MWDEKSPQNNTAKQSRFDLGSEGSNAFDSWCAICNPFSFFILGKNNVQMLIFICPLYFPGRHTVPLNSLPQGIWQMQGQGLPDVSVTAKASGQGWEYTPLTRKRKKKGYLWSHLKESGTGFHQDKKEVRAWPSSVCHRKDKGAEDAGAKRIQGDSEKANLPKQLYNLAEQRIF